MNFTNENITKPPIIHYCPLSKSFTLFQQITEKAFIFGDVVGIFCNILVIFCAFKLLKRTQDTTHIFILSMTAGELLSVIFYSLFNLSTVYEPFRQLKLCSPIVFCLWLGAGVSGLSLTLLNAEKLIYFRWPLHYDKIMSNKRALFFCLFVWAISLGLVCYLWFFQIVTINGASNCRIIVNPQEKLAFTIVTITFGVFPLASSLILSVFLFYLTRQKFIGRIVIKESSREAFKKKLKSLVFIFCTTLWTTFSLVPYRIMLICWIYFVNWNETSCMGQEIINWIASICSYLFAANSIVNPLITAFIYRPYLRLLKGLFKKRN